MCSDLPGCVRTRWDALGSMRSVRTVSEIFKLMRSKIFTWCSFSHPVWHVGMPLKNHLRQKNNGGTHATFAKFSRSFREVFAKFSRFSQVFLGFRTCSDLLGRVRMRSDASGCIWMRSDTFGKFPIFLTKKSIFRILVLGWPSRAPLAGSWRRPDVHVRGG